MAASIKQLLSEANELVPHVTADEASRLIAEEDAFLIDVRDGAELAQSGKLKGATNISRGMIEFRADNATPYYDQNFRQHRPIILYCASGGRSALAGKTLRDMGYQRVFNLGGFKEAAATLPTE